MIDPDKRRVYIYHTQRPRMLIEIHDESLGLSGLYVTGHYENGGIIETFTLSVNDNIDNADKDSAEKVLNKAWHWYIAYLKWEDDNIDTDEQAQLN